jgi:methylmalonyl-CoA/ethylmalonyl-CoA epimerase
MAITGISHIGIVVPDLDIAIDLYRRRLGIVPGPLFESPEQNVRLTQFDLGNARIELLSPVTLTGPIAAFLKRNPSGGLHHLSLSTDDITETLADFESGGAASISGPRCNVLGQTFAFIHPRYMAGVLLELEG